MGFILKFILLAIPGSLFIAVSLAAVGVFLVLTGSPKTCSDRDLGVVSAVLAAQLDERWQQFSAEIAAAAASIEITEAEATARAREYLEREDVPVKDARIYFCGGDQGQLAGKVEAAGIDAEFVATGHLDLSGPQPVVVLDSVDAGNLPGFVSDALLDLLLDDDARTLELDEHLVGSEIMDGLIIISGGPESP